MMDNQNFLIGDLLNENDDALRIQKANMVNEKFIYDSLLLAIVKELKKDEFSFENLGRNQGIKVAIKAVQLANAAKNHQIKMEQ